MKNLKKNPRNLLFELVSLVILGAIILTGCNGIDTGDDISKLVPTYAAQTLQALSMEQTLTAYETMAAQLTQVAQATPAPTETSAAPAATTTSNPTTANPTTAATTQSVPCNWVAYVKDVTIPDSTKMEPGTTFTKTWRLQNIGSCTWTTDYDFVLVNGKALNAPTRIGLPGTVTPGQTIDISVLMKAPDADGIYAGYWMLTDASGNQFGIGPSADGSVWVKINVVSLPKVVYDFTENYCDARWYSGTTKPDSLPCPGDITDGDGFVISDSTPKRESGGEENEHGLIVRPNPNPSDGRIVGFYPSFKIQKGDQFQAVIGCTYGSADCNLRFDLIIQVGPDENVTLGTWNEVYDGKVRTIVIDLSDYAGQEVNFIFRVRNNGTADDNEGLWLFPRIIRQ